MASKGNISWNLQSFLDSLIFELDKAQDRLSVKGLNRRLTYTVKDLSLDLQLFPEFDGETVRFTTAKPGETGASKISLQLGSIRDTQIQEVTKRPPTKDEMSLDEVPLPEEERRELKKLGIQSAEDLQRTIEDKNIDLGKVSDKVDYKNLANLINQSRRKQLAPKVAKVSVSKAQSGDAILTLEGNNLSVASSLTQFPVAMLNNESVEVVSASPHALQLRVPEHQLQNPSKQLKIALDPYAVVTMNLHS